MTPLEIEECDVAGITFKEGTSSIPCFRKGCVTVSNPAQETFLDVSGWGMGEVWINGQYLGAYWEENAEKTLEIPAGALIAVSYTHLDVYKRQTLYIGDRITYELTEEGHTLVAPSPLSVHLDNGTVWGNGCLLYTS